MVTAPSGGVCFIDGTPGRTGLIWGGPDTPADIETPVVVGRSGAT